MKNENKTKAYTHKHTKGKTEDFYGVQIWWKYSPTVGQLMPSILIVEVEVLKVCEDSDTLDDGTNDVRGSDDM